MIVWRRMKLHSDSSSGPGFSRIASGIAILPTSCSSAARPTSSMASGVMSSSRATAMAVSATSVRWAWSSGWRSRRVLSSTSRVWRPADARPWPFSAYIRLSASCMASATVVASPGRSTLPCDAVTVNPSPVSVRAAVAAAITDSRPAGAGPGEHAELVAAKAVGGAVGLAGCAEPAT